MADSQQQQPIPVEEIPRAVFDEVDADKDGLVTKEEAEELLKKIGKELNADAFAAADKDQDGKISYEEFVPLAVPVQA